MNALTIFSGLAQRWHNVGELMQERWLQLLDVIGNDSMKLWVLGTTVVVFTIYWLYAAIYTLMDITNRPKLLRKYKIQPGTNEPVDLAKLWRAIKMVLFNLSVVNLFAIWLFYDLLVKHHNTQDIRVLPSFGRVCRDLAVFTILEEIMFYYAHRLLHHSAIYKYVHKKHHEWTAPIAAITLYAHPIEHIVANLLPVGVSICLTDTHITVAWSMITLAIINSMSDHTGYSFPWSLSSVRFHDYHHAKFNFNYGVMGWLDKLHGTYRSPLKPKQTKVSGKAKKIRHKFK